MKEVQEASDLDGTPLVLVPVREEFCVVEKADYEFLIKSGVSTRWAISNGKYVTAIKNGKRDYIARLICMCRFGQSISYRDGNTLNLRRSNLAVLDKRPAPVVHVREAA